MALVIGLAVYGVIMTVYEHILTKKYNVDKLGLFDVIFLRDKKKNLCIPVGVWFFDKFEF